VDFRASCLLLTQSGHGSPHSKSYFDPVRCALLSLGQGHETPLQRRVGQIATPQIGNAKGRPNATRNRGASVAGEGTVVARLTHERDEALLREAANSEILRLISRSPGDLELVFRSILENAVRICDAKFGNLALLEGDGFRFVAQHGAPPKYRDLRQREPFIRRNTRTNLGRVIKTKQVVHVADVAVEEPNSGIAATAT
jgi:hypothetical protein